MTAPQDLVVKYVVKSTSAHVATKKKTPVTCQHSSQSRKVSCFFSEIRTSIFSVIRNQLSNGSNTWRNAPCEILLCGLLSRSPTVCFLPNAMCRSKKILAQHVALYAHMHACYFYLVNNRGQHRVHYMQSMNATLSTHLGGIATAGQDEQHT